MTHFLVKYYKGGEHIHAQLFTATHPALTHAKNGDVVFREEEWQSFLRCFQDRGTDTITIVPEDDPAHTP